jgi:glycosyltransferase involved in cell wall biosynthesis
MKLLINTAAMRFGGAVQVALSFINECKSFTHHEYHILLGKGVGKSLKKADFPPNFYFYDYNPGPISLWMIPSMAKQLSKYEEEIKPDCVVTTSGPSYWHTKAPHLIGYNLPLYIYTESPYLKILTFKSKLRMFVKRKLHFWYFRRDASAYIVQTDDVNKRVRKALGSEKVYTVSNTHNGFYGSPKQFANKLPFKIKGEIRFLTLTSYYSHKNLEIIPLLSDELKKRSIHNIKFVLTIDDQSYEKIFGKNYLNDVVTLGAVKPEECPSLYQECDIMFLPTLAECFSASYPEAMVMKKPIITTDLGFARDICGNAAVYYEPMNPVAAADAIEKLINDKALQERLIENGLKRVTHFDTAKGRAKKILEICTGLANK